MNTTERTLGGVAAHRRRTGWTKGTCTWCRATVAGKRTAWCSDKCVHEYRVRNDPGYARDATFARDHGVCALCSCDTEAARLHLDALHVHARSLFCPPDRIIPAAECDPGDAVARLMGGRCVRGTIDWSTARAAARKYREAMVRAGLPGGDAGDRVVIHREHRTLWEMDHIVPVVRGGGGCGLDNLRTLCLPCHRRVTAELAAARARERRKQSALFGGGAA